MLGVYFREVHRQLDIHNPDNRQLGGFNICGTLLLLLEMAEIPYHLLKTLGRLQTDLSVEVQQLLASCDSVEKVEAKVDEVLGLLSAGLVPFVQVLKVKCWNRYNILIGRRSKQSSRKWSNPNNVLR